MKRSSVLIWLFGWVLVLNMLWAQSTGHTKEKGLYNPVKQRIEKGQIVKGMYATMKDPFIAKVFARAGFDFIWIDLEHTSLGWHQAEEIIQAICDSEIVPIIRVPWNQHYFIKRALDIGVKGIIVPMVNTKEDAIAAVQACRYPPEGIRGFGPAKAAFYWGIDTREYIRVANNEILVIVQVEDKAAIENIEQIFSVPGVDLAMVGPMDLSGSMGFLGQPTHPEVLSAIDRVAHAGKKHGVPLGTLSLTPDDFKKQIAQGFQFFVVGSDYGILTQGTYDLYNMFQEK